jgi:hypothetical protein
LDVIFIPDVVHINILVETLNLSILIDLLMAIEDNLSAIQYVERSILPGLFNLELFLVSSNFSSGSHVLSFFAMDTVYGAISPGISVNFLAILQATELISPSPSLTEAISLSVTATASESPFPTPILLISMRFGYSNWGGSFYLAGLVNGSEL